MLVEIERDKIYVLANENCFSRQKIKENDEKTNSYFQITKTSKLIDRSNELILDLTQGVKKLINNNVQKIRQSFAIKRVINEVRDSMRNELSNIYDDLLVEEEEIKGENNEEDKKIGEEEYGEESESKSKSKSKSMSKSSSHSSEGENSSPSKSYMEALKRTRNYMKNHTNKNPPENDNKNTGEEKSD